MTTNHGMPTTSTTHPTRQQGAWDVSCLKPQVCFSLFFYFITITTNSFITGTFTIHHPPSIIYHSPSPHHKNNDMSMYWKHVHHDNDVSDHHENSSSSRGLRHNTSWAPGTFFFLFLLSTNYNSFYLCRLYIYHSLAPNSSLKGLRHLTGMFFYLFKKSKFTLLIIIYRNYIWLKQKQQSWLPNQPQTCHNIKKRFFHFFHFVNHEHAITSPKNAQMTSMVKSKFMRQHSLG